MIKRRKINFSRAFRILAGDHCERRRALKRERARASRRSFRVAVVEFLNGNDDANLMFDPKLNCWDVV